jgi:hypothetical protein
MNPDEPSRRVTVMPQPDLSQAHGAWVYLFACVAAGSMIADGHRVEPPLLVGTGAAGMFLVATALAHGARRKRRQLVLGYVLAISMPLLALALGAEKDFVAIGPLAVVGAAGTIGLARLHGLLATSTIALGVATLSTCAPAVALAGGASATDAALAFALLASVFCWRSLRLAALARGQAPWPRAELRAQGLREAGMAAVWAMAVAVAL